MVKGLYTHTDMKESCTTSVTTASMCFKGVGNGRRKKARKRCVFLWGI